MALLEIILITPTCRELIHSNKMKNIALLTSLVCDFMEILEEKYKLDDQIFESRYTPR